MNEDHNTIEKAMQFFINWAPRFKPLIILVDQDAAEMLAMKNLFPLANLILCDFHIKDAWRREFKSLGG